MRAGAQSLHLSPSYRTKEPECSVGSGGRLKVRANDARNARKAKGGGGLAATLERRCSVHAPVRLRGALDYAPDRIRDRESRNFSSGDRRPMSSTPWRLEAFRRNDGGIMKADGQGHWRPRQLGTGANYHGYHNRSGRRRRPAQAPVCWASEFRVGCLTTTSRTPRAVCAQSGRWRGSSRCCWHW